jgi:hypothetical protein
MTTGELTEGSFPDTAENLESNAKTTLEKLTSLWVRMDGLFERIKDMLETRQTEASADLDGGKERPAISASNGGAVAQASITGEKVKGWFSNVILAISILLNVWLIMAYREAGTEQRLQQYNLDWFKTHEFAELKGQVAVDEKLIEVFGSQCRQEK